MVGLWRNEGMWRKTAQAKSNLEILGDNNTIDYYLKVYIGEQTTYTEREHLKSLFRGD